MSRAQLPRGRKFCAALFIVINHYHYSSSFAGEDCHAFDCSSALGDLGVAYAAVFDGHDGNSCSEYCRAGLLPHILGALEASKGTESATNCTIDESFDATTTSGDPEHQRLTSSLIQAFGDAQESFARYRDPPVVGDGAGGRAKKRTNSAGGRGLGCLKCMVSLGCGTESRRGGTTATCLVLRVNDDESKVTAFVANCGDSRCISDGGTGSSKNLPDLEFKNVSVDHRPTEKREEGRLRSAQKRGEVTVARDSMKTRRLYPGGLAVSRTIGDVSLTKAAICKPDVFVLDVELTEVNPKVRARMQCSRSASFFFFFFFLHLII